MSVPDKKLIQIWRVFAIQPVTTARKKGTGHWLFAIVKDFDSLLHPVCFVERSIVYTRVSKSVQAHKQKGRGYFPQETIL